MESGKILRPLTTMLGLRQTKNSGDRDPQQGGNGYSRRYPDRPATKEEIEQVKDWLLAQASVQKSGIKAFIEEKGGVLALIVQDASGKILKTLIGQEIFRLLDSKNDESDRGSILDRRI
jgi:hypothetical protein